MSFLQAVRAAITWRRIGVTLALGLAVGFFRALGQWEAGAVPLRAIAPLLDFPACAIYMMVAALCADEAISRGASQAAACALALSIASIASAMTYFWHFRLWGLLPPDTALHATRTVIAPFALSVGLGGAIVVLTYLNHRTANRILARLHDAELRRVQLERTLIESRLAIAEAHVDPQVLFGALAEIRERFDRAAPDAGGKLDDLIQQLRLALIRTVVATERDAVEP